MPRINFYSRKGQSGAVLYIALIMLVLLALIGIVGLQVTGLQEKMSSNYQSSNRAFQNAEAFARQTECGIEDLVNRTSTVDCPAPTDVAVCDTPFDGPAWADNLQFSGGKQLNVRLIGPCISGNSSLGMGEPVNEDPNPIYQVTAYNTDYDTNPTADAAIDTIFRP